MEKNQMLLDALERHKAAGGKVTETVEVVVPDHSLHLTYRKNDHTGVPAKKGKRWGAGLTSSFELTAAQRRLLNKLPGSISGPSSIFPLAKSKARIAG